ncbi:MAG: hypothetical protein IPL08_21125 [Saprospiraceae bacterium]|nr:hypothetical protein [Saprospiraceae bacterium]
MASRTNRIWFADDGGLSYTTNNGTTWTNIKSLPIIQLSSVRSSKYGSNFLVGLQDAGVQVNMDGHWFQPLGGDGLEVAVDPVDSNIVYGSIQNGQHLQRTIYNPTTQTYVSKTLLTNTQIGHDATWRQKIIIDAADRNTIYTNYRDIWKSTNRGDTWTNLTNGILGNGNTELEFLHQSPSDPNVFVVGWGFTQMRRSSDGGQTWNTITKPANTVFNSQVTKIAFHPTDANTMWMIGNGLVNKTTDGGMTWANVPGTLPAMDLLSIFVQEGTNNGFYVSSTFGNIWYHDDILNSYVLYENGLPNIRTTEIEVLPHLNKIRAATWGRGVWESQLHTPSTNLCSKPNPPVISYTVCAASSVMTIGAAPSGYSIRWEKDGVLISGQTSTSYTATSNGLYRARYMQNTGTCHSYYSDGANVFLRTQPILLNGKGLHFDGTNDHLTFSQGVNLANSSMTISFWAKRQNINYFQTMLKIGNSNAANEVLSVRFESNNKFNFGFEGNNLSTAEAYTDLDWHHYTCVYDKSIASPTHNRFIYRDGVLVASDRSTSDFLGNNQTFIGTYPLSTTGQYYSGTLDDLKIWNVAKSQAQIRQDMFCTPACYASDMLLFLPFTDGVAGGDNSTLTQITEYSLYANHGTLVNFAKTGSTSNIVAGLSQLNGYVDNDSDGFGGAQITECNSGNWVSNNQDCNDNNVNIHPYATEICSNLIDDDCDANTDLEINKALHINGNNHSILIPNIVHQSAFTVEAWVKPDDLEGNGIIEWIGGTQATNLNIAANGALHYNGGGSAWNGGTIFAVGQWAHIALVHDGYSNNNLKAYVNGNLNWTTTINDQITNTSSKIGTNFNGTMDEFRYWNVALSQSQIQERMDATLIGNETSLTRYYHFDHGNAGLNNAGITSVRDKSSNLAHGTLSGFTLNGSTSNWISGRTFPTLYIDTDSDGFGGSTTWTCGSKAGYVLNNNDCNDNSNAIFPGATEICANGVDENCNSINDENTLSLHFDGSNDFVSFVNTLGNFGTNNFSIEMRIKTPINSNNKNVLSKRPVCNYASFFNVKISSAGKLQMEMFQDNAGNNETNITGSSSINDGNWHHVAIVRNNGTMSLYVDGVLDGSTPSTTNVDNTTNLTLGGNNPCGNPFGGEIDEFRIWNVARSANDINVFKNASLTGSESGLQAYYDFNHATAIAGGTNTGLSTLEDRTANNIDGTLTNFTLTGSTSNWLGNPGIINNTSSSASSTPTLCINSALTNITHTTTGATGIGTATGLPTGVGAAWASNTITISGTPTVSGAFNYTIPLTGAAVQSMQRAASRLIL